MAIDPMWEDVFNSREWGKYPAEDLIRFIARNFYSSLNREEVKILEVGCGPGPNLWYLAKEGFQVFGVDGSASAIQKAQARLNLECPGWKGNLSIGDILNLNFEDNHFDAVIDNEAIYANSFEDSVKIYREIFRVVKPGGKLFSRTFAKGSFGDGTGTPKGHNAFLASEGPLAAKGVSRFTEFSEIPNLLGYFEVKEIELLTRTVENRTQEIKEWIIIGEKPKCLS